MRNAAAPALAILFAASALWAASACGSFSADTPGDVADGAAEGAADGPGGEGSIGPDGATSGEPRRIYVVGGELPDATVDGGPVFTSSVLFTTQEADGGLAPWTETTALAPIHGNAAAASGAAIVTLGGEIQDPFGTSASPAASRAAVLTDGKLDTWLDTQLLTDPLYFHATVAVGGNVYVIGGQTPGRGPLATVRVATLAANGAIGTWTTTAPLPAARSRLAAATDGAHIFVVGGGSAADGGTPCEPEVLVGTIGPDGAIVDWAKTGQVYAGASPAVAVFAKKLYILGGFGCAGGASKQVQIAEIQANGILGAFTTGAPLPSASSGLGAVILGQHLYAVGGNDGTTRVPDVFVANLDSTGGYESWAVGTALPVGRSLFGIAAH